MITPDNRVPQDDLQGEDKDDQMSQQDIHSNGFDEEVRYEDDDTPDTDALDQAYDASEPSFTLNLDGDDHTGDDE